VAASPYKIHEIIFKNINIAHKIHKIKQLKHYIYKPESCLENDNYKLYFDRTVLTDTHIQHNRPDKKVYYYTHVIS
jgi:hypothetical protein